MIKYLDQTKKLPNIESNERHSSQMVGRCGICSESWSKKSYRIL